MNRGDLVQVTWIDIYENPVGNPDEAELARRISVGYFWSEVVSQGVPALITTTTIDEADTTVSGWCIYPQSCVVDLKIIKKGRKDGSKSHRSNQESRAKRPPRRRANLPVEGSPAGQREGGGPSGAADPRDGRPSEES